VGIQGLIGCHFWDNTRLFLELVLEIPPSPPLCASFPQLGAQTAHSAVASAGRISTGRSVRLGVRDIVAKDQARRYPLAQEIACLCQLREPRQG
jgi:hypothetical protein